MPQNVIDLTGHVFGRWIVQEQAKAHDSVKDKAAHWRCRCECGTERVVSGRNLRNGASQSCGCLWREKMQRERPERIRDLAGQRFGRMLAVKRVSKLSESSEVYWECVCDCGTVKTVRGHSLISSSVQSCGCLRKEVARDQGKRNKEDLKGIRFSKLTAVEKVVDSSRFIKYRCLCDCGRDSIVRASHLKTGHTKSCGCLRDGSLEHLIGHRFTRLLVVEEADRNEYNNRQYLCQCDCGSVAVVRGYHLTSGRSKSCGCLRRSKVSGNLYEPWRLPTGEALFNVLLREYRRNAAARGLRWDINEQEVKKLFFSPCYYCGVPPTKESYRRDCDDCMLHNGIDRVDNTKGYVSDNCVACCETCNKAKLRMTLEEFEAWTIRLYTTLMKRYDHANHIESENHCKQDKN